MHISYKPLWHTLLERDMRKEDLRLAAGMTTNMIANMSKEGKHISMDTLARICETLNCEITDVIELVPDEPASTGGKEHERIETKNSLLCSDPSNARLRVCGCCHRRWRVSLP